MSFESNQVLLPIVIRVDVNQTMRYKYRWWELWSRFICNISAIPKVFNPAQNGLLSSWSPTNIISFSYKQVICLSFALLQKGSFINKEKYLCIAVCMVHIPWEECLEQKACLWRWPAQQANTSFYVPVWKTSGSFKSGSFHFKYCTTSKMYLMCQFLYMSPEQITVITDIK